MEFNFSWKRLVFLLACLVVFALLGGFTPPFQGEEVEMFSRKATRAWMTCILMFVTGAAMTTIVDHWVGMMPPSNWRPLYMILGILLMIVATVWYRAMLAGWATQTPA